ncbi:hypothetical protein Gpo141_00005105 [Globisporangium polare]
MSDGDVGGGRTGAEVAPTNDMSADKQQQGDGDEWRRWLGQQTRETGSAIDSNLSLFRVGCLLTMVGSIAAVARFSGAFQRFNRIDDIPPWCFSRHKKLRVRMMRQCDDDPSVFYVYHTPFLRRFLLQDALPPNELLFSSSATRNLLAVRPFGVQVDESSHEWILSNYVSSHRYMTIHLLHRLSIAGIDGNSTVATCNMSLRRPPFRRDFAQEIVANGYGECIPESMSKYDDGTGQSLVPLAKRLQQLEASQRHAQVMQYGIWENWQEEKLSSRVVSAGKRVTARGFQKLIDKITH